MQSTTCIRRNDHLAATVGLRLPEDAPEAWALLTRGRIARQNESLALPTTRLRAEHGDIIGARAPETRERNRAMGLLEYIDALELGVA